MLASSDAGLGSDEAYFASSKAGDLPTLLTGCPSAKRLLVNSEPLMREFVEELTAFSARSPAPARPSMLEKRPVTRSPVKTTAFSRSRSFLCGRAAPLSATSASTEAPRPAPTIGRAEFLEACSQLPEFVERLTRGTIIIGNGRTVLGKGAGPLIDRFARVVRFNDYVIKSSGSGDPSMAVDYTADIGSKTDLWVVSDWTCVKLLNKYPNRSTTDAQGREVPMPVMVAIPFNFMGKPYYHTRRAELESELTTEQLERCTFVPAEVAHSIIEGNRFGDRWPSSGLIAIVHLLGSSPKLHIHGFDFFKQIGESMPSKRCMWTSACMAACMVMFHGLKAFTCPCALSLP